MNHYLTMDSLTLQNERKSRNRNSRLIDFAGPSTPVALPTEGTLMQRLEFQSKNREEQRSEITMLTNQMNKKRIARPQSLSLTKSETSNISEKIRKRSSIKPIERRDKRSENSSLHSGGNRKSKKRDEDQESLSTTSSFSVSSGENDTNETTITSSRGTSVALSVMEMEKTKRERILMYRESLNAMMVRQLSADEESITLKEARRQAIEKKIEVVNESQPVVETKADEVNVVKKKNRLSKLFGRIFKMK